MDPDDYVHGLREGYRLIDESEQRRTANRIIRHNDKECPVAVPASNLATRLWALTQSCHSANINLTLIYGKIVDHWEWDIRLETTYGLAIQASGRELDLVLDSIQRGLGWGADDR